MSILVSLSGPHGHSRSTLLFTWSWEIVQWDQEIHLRAPPVSYVAMWRIHFSFAVFFCSPINGLRLLHVKLPRLCNGHCILLTNNKDAPCLAVNFTPSGFAKGAPHARKGFVVVCDSLGSLHCSSLGQGITIYQLHNFRTSLGELTEDGKKNRQTNKPEYEWAIATGSIRAPTTLELFYSHLQNASVITGSLL